MPSHVSPPPQGANVLLLEGVNDSAVEIFQNSKHLSIERLPKALEGKALREAVRGVDLLGIRSRTQLTHDFFSDADRLAAVGCFSVGTNQVDLDAARKRGIDARLFWPGVGELPAAELVLRRLLPIADDGLRRNHPRDPGQGPRPRRRPLARSRLI